MQSIVQLHDKQINIYLPVTIASILRQHKHDTMVVVTRTVYLI